MSCNICCENFKSTRPKICCQYCEFEACRTCCEKYILSEEIPKCMMPGCGKEWARKFIKEKFTNTFLTNDYKQHIETILFDKEKALLPATQPLVEEKKRRENIRKEMRNIDKLIYDLQKQRRTLEFSLYRNENETKVDEKARTFVRQCPADGCRGFLSTQWKCGLCEKWTCPDCHELKGVSRDCDHTCDPNSVETAKLLSSDSKPCPKCQSLIFKIEGCDQMWCTQCRTAFSWKTGKLETRIHNPHYYEWQRKNNGGVAPRNPGDIECGRELNHNLTQNIMALARSHHSSLYKVERDNRGRSYYEYDSKIMLIDNIIRKMLHNTHVELRTFQTDHFEKNQDLRIKYLEDLINEEEFKNLIQRADKKNRKNTEISQIITLCNTAITDIIYRFYDYLKKCKPNEYNLNTFIDEINEIRNYCNNILRDISFTYSSVQYKFDTDFTFKTTEKEKKIKEDKKVKATEIDALGIEEKNNILTKNTSTSKKTNIIILDDDAENVVLSKKA
jgi:hypothetical protein